jgi:hypothetical protein
MGKADDTRLLTAVGPACKAREEGTPVPHSFALTKFLILARYQDPRAISAEGYGSNGARFHQLRYTIRQTSRFAQIDFK